MKRKQVLILFSEWAKKIGFPGLALMPKKVFITLATDWAFFVLRIPEIGTCPFIVYEDGVVEATKFLSAWKLTPVEDSAKKLEGGPE